MTMQFIVAMFKNGSYVDCLKFILHLIKPLIVWDTRGVPQSDWFPFTKPLVPSTIKLLYITLRTMIVHHSLTLLIFEGEVFCWFINTPAGGGTAPNFWYGCSAEGQNRDPMGSSKAKI